jgi:diguanylate cyclase (GGDEF)-like protein
MADSTDADTSGRDRLASARTEADDPVGASIVRLTPAPRPDAAHTPGEAALGRQLHAMSALLLFNEGVAAERPFEELLERLASQLPTVLDARCVALLVADPDGGRMSLYWVRGGTAGPARAERHALDAVPVDRLHGKGGTEAWIQLLDALPAHVREALTDVSPAQLKVTPVGHRDRLLGLLIACPAEDAPLPRAGWAWHQVIARNVATATQRVRRHRDLMRRAYFDTLTGLPNRSLFQDRLQQAVAQARRASRRLAVLYLDIDDFKWVNDTLGHHAGDELLRRMASVLTSSLRETDTVARLAGDEFAIVLPDVGDARQIDKVLATLRSRLQTPAHIAGHDLKLRASIGVAVFPVHAQDADSLLRSADAAMYRVKRARAARRAANAVPTTPAASDVRDGLARSAVVAPTSAHLGETADGELPGSPGDAMPGPTDRLRLH